MKQFYLPLCTMLLISACATRVNYVGTAYAPSQQVDVYVTKDAIKKQYDIIGKGYVHTTTGFYSEEKIQRKAVEKARKKGAHAVLIEDYFILHNDKSITTALSTDSSRNASLLVGTAAAHPSVASGMQILFIRYR